MAAAGNTTLVVYACSVCAKSFGDNHSSCAKHVNGRGKCKERGARVVPVPVSFSRNDRQVGGRLGHLPGPASGLADNSDMERADGRGASASPPPAGIQVILIFYTYPLYLSKLSSHLFSLLILFYPNYPVTLPIFSATCLCSGYITWIVLDKTG